jgi:hypothetical protein
MMGKHAAALTRATHQPFSTKEASFQSFSTEAFA